MVIAIMAIIGAGGVALVSFGSGKQQLVTAQQTMMSMFEEARILASSKNARARVLIYRGDDPARKLRQVGVIYEAYDENGNNLGWVANSAPIMLPKGVYYVPPSGEFKTFAKVADDFNEAEMIYSTFRSGMTGSPDVVGMTDFSRRPQSVGEGNGEWYSYEFSPEGLSENPSAGIIVAAATMNNKGELIVDNPYNILGFVVLRTGRTVGFTDYSEIKGNLRTD